MHKTYVAESIKTLSMEVHFTVHATGFTKTTDWQGSRSFFGVDRSTSVTFFFSILWFRGLIREETYTRRLDGACMRRECCIHPDVPARNIETEWHGSDGYSWIYLPGLMSSFLFFPLLSTL